METPFLDEIIAAGPGGIPTTELWQEIKNNIGGGNSSIAVGQKGSAILAGPTGVAVSINDVGSTNYDILYFVENDSGAGSIGEITFLKNSGTQFTIYNSGSNKTSKIRWWVVPATEASTRGSVTLGGSGGEVVTIDDMGTTEYDVFWWVENDSGAGSIGEVTIQIDSATQFTVYNTGSNTTSILHYWAVTR